ncbi:hypothetical protein QJS66_20280 [Kocuria rhizophila]|nr:hypothetical protein QJS66_20280 [Kocuria rhizophila]
MVIRHAPRTAGAAADDWDRSYSRGPGRLPVSGLRRVKYWPRGAPSADAAGDGTSCAGARPIEAFDAAHAAASGRGEVVASVRPHCTRPSAWRPGSPTGRVHARALRE